MIPYTYIAGAATAVFVGAALKEVTREVAQDASLLGIYKDRDELTSKQYEDEIDRKARRRVEQMKKELGID
jgi:hypothetical protein